MKITIYKCDHCGAILSDEKDFKNHINIDGGRIQLAFKDEHKQIRTANTLTGIKQFCNTACLSRYLEQQEANLAHITKLSMYTVD